MTKELPKKFWRGWTVLEKFQAVFDFAVVIFTAGLWWTSYEQWHITKEGLESVQRAFVIYGGTIADNQRSGPTEEKKRDVTVTDAWMNEGNTPAIQVIHYSKIDELSGEPDGNTFIGDAEEASSKYIGPKGDLTYTNDKPLDFYTGGIAIVRGQSTLHVTKNIFLWGWVRYKDILPDTSFHLTESCYRLSGIGTLPEASSADIPTQQGENYLPMISLSWSGCATHNCVDEDCPDYKKIAALSPNGNN
jgi:hypothetical protein